MNLNRKDLKSISEILSCIDSPEALRLYKKLQKELVPISVSSRKAKGRGLQQTVAQSFSDGTGIPWGYNNEEIQPRLMGGSGTDVIITGRARELIPFDVECKNTESFSIKSVIQQAKANTEQGRYWLIVHKRKGEDPVAIVDFQIFLKLLFKTLE
jgi:hypothetical protein